MKVTRFIREFGMLAFVVAALQVCAASAIARTYGPFVPGEKVSHVIPALVGYAAKGLPSGLKLNKSTGEVAGSAKRPTGASGVTVTFTKKGAQTLTATFIVAPVPTISVRLAGDTEKCRVTGANKAYLVGKSVSLSAVGPKGTAFVGWTCGGKPWPSAAECGMSKLRYVMTSKSLDLVARFKKESISIDASELEDAWIAEGETITEGQIVIHVETQSGLKSLNAAKLPRGLKLMQNRSTGVWSIVGTVRASGEYDVVLKATAKSGAVQQQTVYVWVDGGGWCSGDVCVAKPVIYLYPETETICSVNLDLKGKLTCTYPDYGRTGWQAFVASPDGTLTFANGQQYYCLYWEGDAKAKWDFSRGYCVKGSETASFLADILLRTGLTFREANELIVYWLPRMEDNAYNVIAFQGEAYTRAAELRIDPRPDSLLRVFMAWYPSPRPVAIAAPVIEPFERKGFTVVEWGGTEVD